MPARPCLNAATIDVVLLCCPSGVQAEQMLKLKTVKIQKAKWVLGWAARRWAALGWAGGAGSVVALAALDSTPRLALALV